MHAGKCLYVFLCMAIYGGVFVGIATSTPYQHDEATHDGSFMANFSKPPSAIRSRGRGHQGHQPTANKTIDKVESQSFVARCL